MKVIGLDGRKYNWNLNGYTPSCSADGSSFHIRCRELLAKMFPSDQRLEEVPLPGTKNLKCDFFLPKQRMVVEVHGQQHYEFIIRFHQTPLGFLKAQQRDREKREWCELNGLYYIELPWNESDGEWAERIKNREKTGSA